MTDSPVKQQRATKSDVTFSLFGIMTMIADVVPVRRSGAAGAVQLKSICLECPEPHLVHQQYICTVQPEHGPWTQDQLTRKAKEQAGSLVEVDAGALAITVAESLPDSESMSFLVRDAASVERMTRPDELAYRIRPKAKKTRSAIYSMLEALLADGRFALIGSLCVKGTARQYRLTTWNDQLVLQSLILSADLAPADEIETTEVEPKLLDMALQFATDECSEYSEEDGRNLRAELVAAAVSGAGPGTPVLTKAPVGNDDLLALLEASLATRKAA